MKILFLIFLLIPFPSYSIEVLNYYPYTKNINQGEYIYEFNNGSKYVLRPEKIENSKFQKAIKSAVSELQESISGTCAKKMVVSLNIEASGDWKILGVGLKGGFEVEIMNPKFPVTCAKD